MTAAVLLAIVALAVLAVLLSPDLSKVGCWDHKWLLRQQTLRNMTSEDPKAATAHVRVLPGNVRTVQPQERNLAETPTSEAKQRAA